MRRKKLCASLIPFLAVLPDDVDAAGLLHRLQEWLRGSLADFGGELREHYGLDEYASMDLSRYALSEAPLEPAVELRRLRELVPTSTDTLAMRVGNAFWEGITCTQPAAAHNAPPSI